MSEPIKNVILPTIKKVLATSKLPTDKTSVGNFIAETMSECEKVARRDFKISPNQLGRLRGDWFEYLFEAAISPFIKKEDIRVFPGRGHHINEIKGFEKVTWIPMPDAIVRNLTDLKAVITLKWGMRHDRMYEAAYEAFAIKNWIERRKLRQVEIFLLTNDNFSGYEARLETMSTVPALDGVYYVEHNKLSIDLKSKIKSMSVLIDKINELCRKHS